VFGRLDCTDSAVSGDGTHFHRTTRKWCEAPTALPWGGTPGSRGSEQRDGPGNPGDRSTARPDDRQEPTLRPVAHEPLSEPARRTNFHQSAQALIAASGVVSGRARTSRAPLALSQEALLPEWRTSRRAGPGCGGHIVCRSLPRDRALRPTKEPWGLHTGFTPLGGEVGRRGVSRRVPARASDVLAGKASRAPARRLCHTTSASARRGHRRMTCQFRSKNDP